MVITGLADEVRNSVEDVTLVPRYSRDLLGF